MLNASFLLFHLWKYIQTFESKNVSEISRKISQKILQQTLRLISRWTMDFLENISLDSLNHVTT